MECFWEAFLTQSDTKELVCYLLAYRSVKKPQEYENRLKELNVSDEVKDTLKRHWMSLRRKGGQHKTREGG